MSVTARQTASMQSFSHETLKHLFCPSFSCSFVCFAVLLLFLMQVCNYLRRKERREVVYRLCLFIHNSRRRMRRDNNDNTFDLLSSSCYSNDLLSSIPRVHAHHSSLNKYHSHYLVMDSWWWQIEVVEEGEETQKEAVEQLRRVEVLA